MAKTAYIATDAAGIKHTRNSDRVYTHTVVIKGGYERDLRAANDMAYAAKEANDLWAQVGKGLEGYVANGLRKHAILGRDYFVKRFAEDSAIVAQFGTAAAYIDSKRAAHVARVEAEKAAGRFEKWGNIGWCGRLDLAQKLAAKYQGDYTVAILPAEKA
jgi:hypothetical protein